MFGATYLREDSHQSSSSFKVPKSNKDNFLFLSDLKPDLKYEVWIEAYLSNGRKRQSNVITIITKVGNLPTPERSEIGELFFLNLVFLSS